LGNEPAIDVAAKAFVDQRGGGKDQDDRNEDKNSKLMGGFISAAKAEYAFMRQFKLAPSSRMLKYALHECQI